jgi:hypothetical protein
MHAKEIPQGFDVNEQQLQNGGQDDRPQQVRVRKKVELSQQLTAGTNG